MKAHFFVTKATLHKKNKSNIVETEKPLKQLKEKKMIKKENLAKTSIALAYIKQIVKPFNNYLKNYDKNPVLESNNTLNLIKKDKHENCNKKKKKKKKQRVLK